MFWISQRLVSRCSFHPISNKEPIKGKYMYVCPCVFLGLVEVIHVHCFSSFFQPLLGVGIRGIRLLVEFISFFLVGKKHAAFKYLLYDSLISWRYWTV